MQFIIEIVILYAVRDIKNSMLVQSKIIIISGVNAVVTEQSFKGFKHLPEFSSQRDPFSFFYESP